MPDTKERILRTALKLFSGNGYKAVSVSMISGEFGMAKSALYKHYAGKRDIFETIVRCMETLDRERARVYRMSEEPLGKAEEAYSNTSFGKMCEYSIAQFLYWTGDKCASCFRKMLRLEQYRDPENAKAMALEVYSPMYMLYSVCDGRSRRRIRR